MQNVGNVKFGNFQILKIFVTLHLQNQVNHTQCLTIHGIIPGKSSSNVGYKIVYIYIGVEIYFWKYTMYMHL